MSAYGQSIPPRWYRDIVAKQVTKMNFAHLIHRALMQVGMIPIRAWNPFDLELPANADVAVSTRSDLIWYYDFPTSETYTVNAVQYRPCLALVVMIREDNASTALSEASNWVRFEIGYRRADRTVRDDWMNFRRAVITSTNFGHFLFSDSYGSGGSVNSGFELIGLGAGYGTTTWKTHGASTSTQRTELLGIRNIHVILCKGGLLIQVGTGLGKQDSNDIFSVLYAFGGARIPGRARVPASDPNLNLINPILPLSLRHSLEAVGQQWYSSSLSYDDLTFSGVRLASYVFGVQHDLKVCFASATSFATRPGMAHAQVFNIENIERPFFPSLRGDTVNSPRYHPLGTSHILQPIVYVQDFQYSSTEYFSVQDFNVRSQIAPTWFDVWYCPKVRLADRTAPIGEYVDPVTGLNWWLFRAEGTNTIMAVEVEGITKYTTLGYFDTFNLADTDYFNLNAGFSWTAGNPQQAVISQTQGTSMTQNWTATPATDEATAIHTAVSGASTLTFVAEPYSVSSDTAFSVQMELRWYSATAQAGSTDNSMFVEISSDDGTTWVTVQTIFNNGTNTGNPYHAYTATPEYTIRPGPTDSKLRFRIRTVYSSATGGLRTAAIRGIRIRQYTRA